MRCSSIVGGQCAHICKGISSVRGLVHGVGDNEEFLRRLKAENLSAWRAILYASGGEGQRRDMA